MTTDPPRRRGRIPGTPNFKTKRLLEKLRHELGMPPFDNPDYDPLVELAKIGLNTKIDITVRVVCHREVAQYIHCKRAPIHGDDEGDDSAMEQRLPVLDRLVEMLERTGERMKQQQQPALIDVTPDKPKGQT